MTWRRLLALAGSTILHLGAIGAVLLLVAALREPQPLFVDLTAGDEPAGGPAAPAGPPRAAKPAGARIRDAARALTGVSRAPAPLLPAAPVAAPPPSSAPAFSASSEPAAPEYAAPPLASGPARAEAGRTASDAPATAPGSPGGTGSGAGGGRLALAREGTGTGQTPPEFGPYLARFRQRIQELVVYPLAARRRGLAGRVEIELLLEPSGRVHDAAVVGTSSHALLDEAALDAVRSLPPVPLPEHLPRRPLRVRLPIVFQLQ